MATIYYILPGKTVTIGDDNGATLVVYGGSAAVYGWGGGILNETHDANQAIVTINGGVFTLGHDANGASITLNSATFNMAAGHDLNNAVVNFGSGISEAILSAPVSAQGNLENASFRSLAAGDQIEFNGITNISGLSYAGGKLRFSGLYGGHSVSYSINLTVAAGATPYFAASLDSTTGYWRIEQIGRTIGSAVAGPVVLGALDNPLTIAATGSVTSTASGADGIDGGAGTAWNVMNFGHVTSSSGFGVALSGSGSVVTNSGAITGGEDGVLFLAGAGSLNNSGTIVATIDDGVDFFSGGSLTNTAGATISGLAGSSAGAFFTGGAGSIRNDGSLTGSKFGTLLADGGVVVNGASNPHASISGQSFGVYFESAAAGAVTNGGLISASAAGGVAIELDDGGAVANNAGGSITGGAYGVFATGAATTVANSGTISGAAYAVYFSQTNAANRVAVNPGAVFAGSVWGGGGTLELASGLGAIGNIDNGQFGGFQGLAVDAGGTWKLNGSSSVANVIDNGVLVVGGASALDVSGAVDPASTGQFQLAAGAALEIASALGSKTQISFVGASELTIDNAALFGTNVGSTAYAGPLLENFGHGDAIDIHSFAIAQAILAYNPGSGLLQIGNGAQTATLDFQNATLGAGSFSLASDGGGGVFLTRG